jgi:transposase
MGRLPVEIVKRSDRAKGFVVEPKRWIVERSIAWLNRCRRLAKRDFFATVVPCEVISPMISD